MKKNTLIKSFFSYRDKPTKEDIQSFFSNLIKTDSQLFINSKEDDNSLEDNEYNVDITFGDLGEVSFTFIGKQLFLEEYNSKVEIKYFSKLTKIIKEYQLIYKS